MPMFQVEPVLLRKKMIVSAFHLSQVSGHTPKARSRNVGEKTRRVRSTAVEIQWRLEPNDETERLTNFGQLPRSSCLDFERRRSEFPPSLKRRYINMRNQSLYSKHRASNAGRSSRIVRLVEKLHAIADGRVANVADDAQDVSESTRGNTTNQTECLDFEDDCRSFSFDTDQPTFDCRKSMSVDADRDHANINLDAIFGPLNRVSPAGSDISKIAHLFHAHNNCRVVAPPGMALDESDEETATSALSEMSTTDDLCAFFDKTNNVDLGSSPKVFFSELNPLNSNGEVDSCSDRLSDVGASYEIDAHSADDEVVTGNEAETISKLKTTRKPAGNNKEETEVGMSCNQCAEMNGSIFTSAVESIGTETSQSPASEDNRSSSNATTHYEPREFSQEKCTEEYVQNQSNWNGMMSFRLPTPPPSSDDSDDSSNSSLPPITESLEIDDNICEEAISNKGEEAISNKGEFFFQLPTQDSSSSSSSSEEEDGDNEAGSIDDQNEKSSERPLLGCNNPETTNCNPPLFEVTNTIAAIAHENSYDGIARLTTSDHCSAHNIILSPCHTQFQSASSSTMSVPDSLTDTPIRTNESESKPTARTDDLSDTPLQNRQCTGQQRASLDSLTDTPLEQHKNAGKVRKRLKVAPVTAQMTQPLQNLQCTEQRLQSFDSLTDTPLEQRKTTGNLRKRLKVAPETDLTNQPEALLQSQHHTDHNRNSLDSLTDTPLEQHKTVGKLRKRLRVAPGRDRTNHPEAETTVEFQDMDKVRKKMEQKYRCKFLDTEAYDESENSDDEEDIIQQIEDEEMSQ